MKIHLCLAPHYQISTSEAVECKDRNPGSVLHWNPLRVVLPNGDQYRFLTQDFRLEQIEGLVIESWVAHPETRLLCSQWATLMSRVRPAMGHDSTPLASVENAARVLEDHDMLEEAEKLRDIYR